MPNSTHRPSDPVVGKRRRPFSPSSAPVVTASNTTAQVRDLTNEPVVIRRVPRAWFEPLTVRPLVEFAQAGEIKGVAHASGEGLAKVRRRPFSDLACPLLTSPTTTPVVDIVLRDADPLIRPRRRVVPDLAGVHVVQPPSTVDIGWLASYPPFPAKRKHRLTDVAIRSVAFEETTTPTPVSFFDAVYPTGMPPRIALRQAPHITPVGFEDPNSPALNLSYKFVGPDSLVRARGQRHLYPSVTLQTIPPAVLPAPEGWDPFYPERVVRRPLLRQDGNVVLNYVAPPPDLSAENQYPDIVRGAKPLVPEGLAVRTFGPIDFGVPDGSWSPTFPARVPGKPPRGFTGIWSWLDPSPTLITPVGSALRRLLTKVGL